MNNQDSNKLKGYIALYRSLKDNFLWQDKPFKKGQAWIDILLTVNHSKQQTAIENMIFICNPGESLRSLDSWGKRWGWTKSKVNRFLVSLQKAGMIRIKNETRTTRISICNWEAYQTNTKRVAKRDRNGSETEAKSNKNVNNDKEHSALIKNLVSVQKMEEPLTSEQGALLIEEFGLEKVNETLLAMDNYKPLLKKYKSTYMTALNWLNKVKPQMATINDWTPQYNTNEL